MNNQKLLYLLLLLVSEVYILIIVYDLLVKFFLVMILSIVVIFFKSFKIEHFHSFKNFMAIFIKHDLSIVGQRDIKYVYLHHFLGEETSEWEEHAVLYTRVQPRVYRKHLCSYYHAYIKPLI